MGQGYELVVVANRLPVDIGVDDDGGISWRRSPGGLVSALEPVMQSADGAWVGWTGSPDVAADPFDADGMHLVPVALSAEEVADYYEGFSNDTLWPLSHDVISPPEFHRSWWDAYRRVNRRFAEAAAAQAAPDAVVWVHDYQLQLVPALLRELRPDLRIGYFHHIPFPPLEIFAQLPWRRQVVEGLLGADLLGFQRTGDAANFVRVVRRMTDLTTRGQFISVPADDGPPRQVRAAAFPISIDSAKFDAMARSEQVRARAREIRADLGDPEVLLLGVDRLDYTKGIRHRIKAFGELVEEGRLEVPSATLVQVASPSRENVEAYQQLRDEVETLVGRINGEHGRIGAAPVHYLHHSYPPEEMAAMYLAADVMLVTSLRDGMNLVAKEFVASCVDERGALVLSEFTGAADELSGALLVNPHDIDGLKDAIERAARMEPREQRTRMRRLRRRVLHNDVAKWSQSFLDNLRSVHADPGPRGTADEAALAAALAELADHARRGAIALIALDFDGTLAPLVDDPAASRALPAAAHAMDALARVPGVRLALVSGRAVEDLARLAEVPEGTYLVGSHGAERGRWSAGRLERTPLEMDDATAARHADLVRELQEAAEGTTGRIEVKPASVVLHTRTATPQDAARLTDVALRLGERDGVDAMRGKDVVELAVLRVDKGQALAALREETGAASLLYAGDDVTDERAFAALADDDVTVRVGPGRTGARFRVSGPEALATVLGQLSEQIS